MRLPIRLLLGYAAVILILLVSGALIVQRTVREMRASVATDAVTIAQVLMDEIDLVVRDRIQAIRAVAGSSVQIHEGLSAANARHAALGSDEAVRARIDALDREWRGAPADEPTAGMREVLDSPLSATLHRAMAIHRTASGSPIFGEIFVTDRHGGNAGQTGRTTDYRQDDETWWQAAWADGLWVADEVVYDESAGVHSLDIGIRVEDPDGARLGVLKAVLNVETLRDILDDFAARSRYAGAVAEVVDAQGRLIYRQGDSITSGEDRSANPAIREALRSPSGSGIDASTGDEVLRSHARSRGSGDVPSLGWTLLLERPTSVAHAPIHRLQRWALMVGVLGTLAAALVGFVITSEFGRMTRRLEEAGTELAAGEARIRSVLENVVDGIVTIDPVGRIESTNPAVGRIFGYEPDEMHGRNVRMLMPEPYAGEHDGYLRNFLESGVAKIIGLGREVEGRRKDGTTFPLELAVSEIRERRSHRFVGILRDVSERHRARRELLAAKHAAEAASRSKGQFLANMSHELRTPLNAVIGYAELVGEELEDRGESALLEDMGKIRSAGRHLLGLISDVLDVSKIEAGRVEVFAETFDLHDVIREIAETVRPLVAERGNALDIDLAADLPRMHSDVTKVRQILFNLLSNAAKFTRDGRIVLSVHAVPGGRIRFGVADDGIGMTTEHLERVWDAFQQADASTTRQFGGTGLGLTITKSFTELLGGSIEVQSTEGEGTTFQIELPSRLAAPGIDDVEAAAPGPPAPDEPSGPQDGGVTATVDTVLVIDDDRATREIVRRVLARQGIDVIAAENGPEGLRLARETMPSAIVLDVMMPGMDGWAVLAALRDDPELAHIPVIMLTMANQRDLGLALGVDGYLRKPVDSAALAALLARQCKATDRCTVLVVEDDPNARDLVVRMLTSRGWRVDQAEHGLAALERLEVSPPDVLLVDLMMPVMDGFELVAAVRADERWRDLPVIVLTAKEITEEDAARLEGSVQKLVRKGAASQEDILAEVGRLVRRAAQQR
jgi:PAS domain S-box-containing protein